MNNQILTETKFWSKFVDQMDAYQNARGTLELPSAMSVYIQDTVLNPKLLRKVKNKRFSYFLSKSCVVNDIVRCKAIILNKKHKNKEKFDIYVFFVDIFYLSFVFKEQNYPITTGQQIDTKKINLKSREDKEDTFADKAKSFNMEIKDSNFFYDYVYNNFALYTYKDNKILMLVDNETINDENEQYILFCSDENSQDGKAKIFTQKNNPFFSYQQISDQIVSENFKKTLTLPLADPDSFILSDVSSDNFIQLSRVFDIDYTLNSKPFKIIGINPLQLFAENCIPKKEVNGALDVVKMCIVTKNAKATGDLMYKDGDKIKILHVIIEKFENKPLWVMYLPNTYFVPHFLSEQILLYMCLSEKYPKLKIFM